MKFLLLALIVAVAATTASAATTAPAPQCPEVPSDSFGTCPECIESDCLEEGKICCPNGCGHSCQFPIDSTVPPHTTVTDECAVTCISPPPCRENESPTSTPCCGNSCTPQIDPCDLVACESPPCRENESPTSTPCCGNSCTPQIDPCDLVACEFPECVDGEVPIYDDPDSCCPYCGVPPNTCVYQGVTYDTGSSFDAADGCNTCFCDSGHIACTELYCDICILPPETGICEAIIPSYFYNSTTGNCESFAYGGCGGNENRFSTVEDCRHRCGVPPNTCVYQGVTYDTGSSFDAADGCNTCFCDSGHIACTLIYCDICFLPPETGDCDAVVPSYFYNSSTENCESFIYGGCGGNENRFSTIEDCRQRCGQTPTPPPACVYEGVSYDAGDSFPAADGCNTCFCESAGFIACTEIGCIDVCDLRPDSGLCLAYFPSFFYNSTSGNCESFIYGGCGGNENRFLTIEECQDRCGSTTTNTTPPPRTCVYQGTVYNGGDSFLAADGCNTCTCIDGPVIACTRIACPDICFLPFLIGDCDALYPSYYYNAETERCEFFDYGGCGGNDNRFPTLQACQERCDPNALTIPITSIARRCPVISDTAIGSCIEACQNCDLEDLNQLCCSNGCGHVCTSADNIPYYEIPLVCPEIESDVIGTCQQECNSDSDCTGTDNNMCCSNGCGYTCVSGVSAIETCSAIVDQFPSMTPLGAYIPQCRDDGSFAHIQYHEAGSWCVNTQTGLPISGFYSLGTQPDCSICEYNDARYAAGDSFPASDGCNSCFCSENGFVACTLALCIDTCSLLADPGPCRGAFPAYYYDYESQTCRQFTYGGCHGNANKFSTVVDCLDRCNPESVCLHEPDLRVCDFFGGIFYNTTSNICELSPFGYCINNENRFSSAYECQDVCNPDGPINECIDIACDFPICADGFEVTYDDVNCCPYCSPPTQCPDDVYRCTDGQCIPTDWLCDMVTDCVFGEDENDCDIVLPCDFRCGTDDGACIPDYYVCDGYPDCPNNRDESSCIDQPPRDAQYFDVVRACPSSTDLFGACVEECQDDSQCREDEDQLCCSNGCGFTCMEGLPVSPLCLAVRDSVSGLIGAFVPQCEADGSFSEVQCHGSTGFCWCVDIATGWPQTEGVAPTDGAPQCSSCVYDGRTYPVGFSFTAEDDCNTCHCTNEGVICTYEPCAPASCEVGGSVIDHGGFLDDDCSICACTFGQLSCTRKECKPFTVDDLKLTMPFKDIARDRLRRNPDEDLEQSEDFKREILRTFLRRYGESLNFDQAQLDISNIDVRIVTLTSLKQKVKVEDDTIVVIVEVTNLEQTAGANVTILVEQIKYDYQTRSLLIRYNNRALQPSGQFSSSSSSVTGSGVALVWWQILLIVLGALAVVIIVASVILGVVVWSRKQKGQSRTVPSTNQAVENPTYQELKQADDIMKIPLDGSENI